MKPSSIKAKGRNAENIVVRYLSRWWPNVERRRLAGVHDRGDITGIPDTVIEVKSGARIDLPAWLAELAAEMQNDGARYGAVAVKPKGTQNPDEFYWVMPSAVFVTMLADALQGREQ